MTDHETQPHADLDADVRIRAERAERLQRFRGPVQERDAEVIEHWRRASPAAHAAAMIDLGRYAEQMVALTGMGKDPIEMFPGFPKQRRPGPPGDRSR